MKIQESGENYLETILILSKKQGSVRSIDVARELGFSKPSISRAMHILQDNGYLDMDANGLILLTEKGKETAERVYDRHLTLTKCLHALGVSEETAAQDACRIEHVISQESFDCLKRHLTDKLKTETS